ncbi:MAG: hypothetical protein WC732_02670 [Candidatus Omnitrophota bacterium]
MKNRAIAWILGFLMALTAGAAFASGSIETEQPQVKEPQAREEAAFTGFTRKDGKHKGVRKGEPGHSDYRRKNFRKRLMHLKEKDPEKYQEVVGKIRNMKTAKLQQLKERDPEKFKEIMEQRRQRLQGRLEELKKTDPQKYEKIMAFKEKLGRLKELKEKDPKAYEEFLQQHPRLKNRLGGGARRMGMPLEAQDTN